MSARGALLRAGIHNKNQQTHTMKLIKVLLPALVALFLGACASKPSHTTTVPPATSSSTVVVPPK